MGRWRCSGRSDGDDGGVGNGNGLVHAHDDGRGVPPRTV